MAGAVLYWDSSVVLSVLLKDTHTREAVALIRRPGVHLLSTLAWAEVHAVVARIQRERILPTALLDAARDALQRGPCRRASASPDWRLMQTLAIRWSLRGPDLWHLATAKSLRVELPELRVVSFDSRLTAAARGEGLA